MNYTKNSVTERNLASGGTQYPQLKNFVITKQFRFP